MANEEYLQILRSGADEWNKWRGRNLLIHFDLNDANVARLRLQGADLHGTEMQRANLYGAELAEVNFSHAQLTEANFSHSNLSSANLQGAHLHAVNFRRANLHHANLADTNLADADLTEAVLDHANLYKCYFGGTSLAGVSLVLVDGLETVQHLGPSYISVDTLEATASDLSADASRQREIETFLQYAGVPDEYMEFFRQRIGQAIQFYSVFISYSSIDEYFADRLYADLRQKNIRCWLASEDLKIGDKFRLKINEQIRQHDKLVLILSERSIESSWVEYEVKQAFEREKVEGKDVLFPIRIDDAVMETPEAWAAQVRKHCHIGDFCKWKDHDEYQKSLLRLIRDLRAEEVRKSTPASH